MIYFIRSDDGSKIKIGWTGDLKRRLPELSSQFDCKFEVLAIADGRLNEESSLHDKFAKFRIEREFFEPSDELLDYIKENGRNWDGMEDDWQPRSRHYLDKNPVVMGAILRENLIRLAYYEDVIKTKEIAKLVTERTGKSMSRQRIANLLNSVHITDATLETIAKALKVEPSDLIPRNSG